MWIHILLFSKVWQVIIYLNSASTQRQYWIPGEVPAQRPVTQSFDVFFELHPNKRLSKQWWGWWFETLSRPLWRHRNDFPSQPSMCWSTNHNLPEIPNRIGATATPSQTYLQDLHFNHMHGCVLVMPCVRLTTRVELLRFYDNSLLNISMILLISKLQKRVEFDLLGRIVFQLCPRHLLSSPKWNSASKSINQCHSTFTLSTMWIYLLLFSTGWQVIIFLAVHWPNAIIELWNRGHKHHKSLSIRNPNLIFTAAAPLRRIFIMILKYNLFQYCNKCKRRCVGNHFFIMPAKPQISPTQYSHPESPR